MPIREEIDKTSRSGLRMVSKLKSDHRAQCEQCGFTTADDKDLPFYQELKNTGGQRIKAKFYCGCYGWD